MANFSLDSYARNVLASYPALAGGTVLVSLGNAGGFSGASLWRVQTAAGHFCLRAWPVGGMAGARLLAIHRWMASARQAGLDCVPGVMPTRFGPTWVVAAYRLWDLTTWMPGLADSHAHPSRARLQAACTTLARLHRIWAGNTLAHGPCPAVHRRLQRARVWTELAASGWTPLSNDNLGDPVRPLAERAWRLLPPRIERIPRQLAPWGDRHVTLQPCLCDIWRAHVLFTGDEVTGLIDFGGAKIDHVAVDLARLLGSLVGDDAEARAWGIQAYSQLRPLTAADEALLAVLDETGTLLGAANWLMWLYREGRAFEDRPAAARRLGELVERIAGWD